MLKFNSFAMAKIKPKIPASPKCKQTKKFWWGAFSSIVPTFGLNLILPYILTLEHGNRLRKIFLLF